jgi:hypothetical protein
MSSTFYIPYTFLYGDPFLKISISSVSALCKVVLTFNRYIPELNSVNSVQYTTQIQNLIDIRSVVLKRTDGHTDKSYQLSVNSLHSVLTILRSAKHSQEKSFSQKNWFCSGFSLILAMRSSIPYSEFPYACLVQIICQYNVGHYPVSEVYPTYTMFRLLALLPSSGNWLSLY